MDGLLGSQLVMLTLLGGFMAATWDDAGLGTAEAKEGGTWSSRYDHPETADPFAGVNPAYSVYSAKATETVPAAYFHGPTDPKVDPTEWVSISHEGVPGRLVMRCGTGTVVTMDDAQTAAATEYFCGYCPDTTPATAAAAGVPVATDTKPQGNPWWHFALAFAGVVFFLAIGCGWFPLWLFPDAPEPAALVEAHPEPDLDALLAEEDAALRREIQESHADYLQREADHRQREADRLLAAIRPGSPPGVEKPETYDGAIGKAMAEVYGKAPKGPAVERRA